MRHRDNDKPAVLYGKGVKQWWVNGKLHRDGDKPALIYNNGAKQWWLNGECHRDGDNPAVISDGTKFWYIHGKLIKRKLENSIHES